MFDFIRRDSAFILIILIGLVAGYKYYAGEQRDREAWVAFRVAHACQAISSVAWRCDDGQTYFPSKAR